MCVCFFLYLLFSPLVFISSFSHSTVHQWNWNGLSSLRRASYIQTDFLGFCIEQISSVNWVNNLDHSDWKSCAYTDTHRTHTRHSKQSNSIQFFVEIESIEENFHLLPFKTPIDERPFLYTMESIERTSRVPRKQRKLIK